MFRSSSSLLTRTVRTLSDERMQTYVFASSLQPASKLVVFVQNRPGSLNRPAIKHTGDPRLMLKTILIALISLFLVSNGSDKSLVRLQQAGRTADRHA